MFFAVHSGFEEGKFDKHSVQNMALKLKTLQKYQTEVQCFSKIFRPTWHEMLCSIFLGFEAWKFDRPVFEALQNRQKEVQRYSKIFAPTWHGMSCAIFSGFVAWKFDKHSAQNVGYVVVVVAAAAVVVAAGVIVDVVFSLCFRFGRDFIVTGNNINGCKPFAPPRLFIQLPAKGEHRAAM